MRDAKVVSLVHPFFLEFTHNVQDEYWKLLYEDMAFGKFPSGVYILKDHFCCFHKGREFSVPLNNTETDTFSLFTQIHSLLNTRMGIQSEEEKKVMKERLMAPAPIIKEEPSTKRLIKDSTLTSFILQQGERYRLPDNILRKIFSLFIIGFMFKTILVKDVVFEGNEITGIHGFQFSEKKVKIERDVIQLKKNQVFLETPRPDITSLSSSWPKYLQSLSIQIS
jgi:hypothetical protein